MTMKRVLMELARDKEFPNGSSAHGYEFAAPLDDDGHLIARDWATLRERCRVKRFWGSEPDQMGLLVHRRGDHWLFDYDATKTSDDEPGFKFSTHAFVPGEYVSVTEHDGVMRAFRVMRVSDLD